jgi:predicted regulator of Ras-like GTPase activity (Roadblock/LC7/MglB family)
VPPGRRAPAVGGPVVRADWSIFEEDYWAIRSILTELLKNSNAQSVLLIDRTGQLISSLGSPPDFDIISFASLCAADFEANTQLAQLIGERDFTTLYHQGADESMYLSRVDPRVIVAVLFDRHTTLGLVRLRVKKAVEQLAAIIGRLFEKLEYTNEEFSQDVDAEFTLRAEAEIDNLFRD